VSSIADEIYEDVKAFLASLPVPSSVPEPPTIYVEQTEFAPRAIEDQRKPEERWRGTTEAAMPPTGETVTEQPSSFSDASQINIITSADWSVI
jgi:hypothetical protein